MKKYIYITIIFIALLITFCGESSEEEKNSGVINDSESDKDMNNNNSNILNKPSINSMSRLGFTYKFLPTDKEQMEIIENANYILIYDKIENDEPKFEIEENEDIWVNMTTNKNWYQVIVNDSKWGYIKKDNVKLYPRAMVNINSGTLNLREGKGTGTKIIKGLEKEQLIYVTNISDKDWFNVKTYDGETGYVASKYLKFIDKKTNLFAGISQEEFLSNYSQLKEEEYLLLMEDYKLSALNKHIVRGDFNGGGNIDKAFFALKNNSDKLNLVIWNSEPNRYIIVDTLKMPSFVGIEIFPQQEELSSSFEQGSAYMIADGISLISYDEGYNIVYYWTGKSYKGFTYNK